MGYSTMVNVDGWATHVPVTADVDGIVRTKEVEIFEMPDGSVHIRSRRAVLIVEPLDRGEIIVRAEAMR